MVPASYCTGDLKDFTMTIFQYMRFHQKYIPSEILDSYNLKAENFDSKGYAYLEIRKGMYSLKEVSTLAYDQLKAHLAIYGYVTLIAVQTDAYACQTQPLLAVASPLQSDVAPIAIACSLTTSHNLYASHPLLHGTDPRLNPLHRCRYLYRLQCFFVARLIDC